ncbi:MAG: aminotransferase class I/II-fold pyridoxal phosphate-dependent enzyme [Promethearchaeota archaeon]
MLKMDFLHLEKTPIYRCLSSVGRRILQPNGIFYWTERSKSEAEINATIGTAGGFESDIIEDGRPIQVPYYLPEIKQYINLPPEKLVAYAPIAGIPKLREIWTKWIISKGKREANMPSGPVDVSNLISKPVICNGITHAFFLACRLFLDTGETIICPNKRWGNYNSVLRLQGGINIENFQFFKEQRFNLSGMVKRMYHVAKIQTRIVIILNFPNNPTGYCPKPDEIKEIKKALNDFIADRKKPVVVICDDAYEGYTYSDKVIGNSIFYELVNFNPLLIPIKLDGTSKEMLMYGGRVAATTLGLHEDWFTDENDKRKLLEEWDNKVQGMVRSSISNCNHFTQEILVKIMENGFDSVLQSRQMVMDILSKRYKAFMQAYKKYNPPYIEMDPNGGGFFVFLNIDGIPADELADHLLKKYKVGTFPNVNIRMKINGIRVAFCSIPLDQIDECVKRIDLAVRDLHK